MPNNPITPTNEARTNGTVIDASHTNDLASALNRLVGITSTASSAGTLTLVVGSMRTQQITGTTTHTVVMPVVSTLGLGFPFKIINDSTGIVTVNSSGGNLIYAIPAGVTVDFICILLTGTTAASWLADYPASSSGTPAFVGCIAYGAVNLAFSSTPTAISDLTTEIVDTDAFHNTVTNTSRMTIPSGKDGKYRMEININLASTAGMQNLYLRAYKNGVAITEGLTNGNVDTKTTGEPQDGFFRGNLVVTGVATDYFEFFILSASGAPTINKARYSFTFLGA